MNTAYLTRIISLFAICYALASASMIGIASAQDLSAVKARMSQRLPSVDKLKAVSPARIRQQAAICCKYFGFARFILHCPYRKMVCLVSVPFDIRA